MMRRYLLATTAAFGICSAQAQTVDLNLSNVTRDGGPSTWDTHYGFGGNETQLPTGETQHYANANVSTGNGGITLTAKGDGTSGAVTSGTEYYGMPKPGGFSMTYGTVNITAAVPSGKGLWPALWLMPIKPGVACEIDINEAPFNDPTKYQASLHDGGTGYTTSVALPNMTQPNTYGVSVQPDTITYLLNGQTVGKTPTPPQCNTPLYLLANVATGGWAGATTSASFPASMQISKIAYTPGPNGTASGGLIGAPTTVASAAPAPAESASGQPTEAAPDSGPDAQIKPGSGSVKDCHGNIWTITPSGSIMEGNQYTPGGGGTAALAINGCTVYGLDSSGRGWFTLSGDGQYWSNATPPDGGGGSPIGSAPPVPETPPAIQQIAQQPPVVCGTQVAGGFKTVNGRIVGPNGDFVARGINVRSNELGDVTNGTVTATFPGLNFVRINVRALDDPASLAGAVTYLTSRGIVAELEDHPDGGGAQDAWSSKPGDVAWYGRVAAYFKDNPYVWFGSFNEPAPDNLSAWQQATYQAIRGAGNNNPILMEVSGSRPNNLDTALTSNVYAAMTNVIADVHTYNYQSNNSTDQATVDANVIDMFNASHRLQSADGVMPVIDGEYGDSTDGSNVDAGGTQQIQAVINAGSGGPKVGSAAWSWVCGGADCLRNGGGGLTQFGQMVKLYINTSVVPCSPSEQNKIAQQTLNQVTQIATQTPDPAQPDPGQPAATTTSSPPPSADPTVVQADQAAQQATDVVAQAAALRQSNP